MRRPVVVRKQWKRTAGANKKSRQLGWRHKKHFLPLQKGRKKKERKTIGMRFWPTDRRCRQATVRRMVYGGARWLMNLTNDLWRSVTRLEHWSTPERSSDKGLRKRITADTHASSYTATPLLSPIVRRTQPGAPTSHRSFSVSLTPLRHRSEGSARATTGAAHKQPACLPAARCAHVHIDAHPATEIDGTLVRRSAR